jgi:hypothetical protein
LALFAATSTPIHAQISGHAFTVNNTQDLTDVYPGDGVCAASDGTCTLRAAIQETNASGGADSITLPAGTYTLTIADANIDNLEQAGDLDIFDSVDISGAGAGETIIQAGTDLSNSVDRVFEIEHTAIVTISGVTIRNGKTNGDSGAIRNRGVVTIKSSIVSNSNARSSGGAAVNNGVVTLIDSTIRGHTALSSGGGIANFGTMAIFRSTISGNAGTFNGGGISNFGALTLTNSTVSNNSSGAGGGIYHNSPHSQLQLYNVTIAENSSDSDRNGNGAGGGLVYGMTPLSPADGIIMANTIIANNLDRTGQANDCVGTLTSRGYNLIQSTQGCTLAGNSALDLLDQEARIGDLRDNGGPTQTHRPLLARPVGSSPAISGGDPTGCKGADGQLLTTDQRGVTRPIEFCDIGAVQLSPEEANERPPVR